jgi:adenosylhomocysteine nucleosidase
MSLLICFALKEEAAPFRKIAAGRPGVFALVTGIGKKNAERAIRNFLTGGASVPAPATPKPGEGWSRPTMVFTCGFAGGLEPRLTPGEVLFEIDNRRDELHESPSNLEVGDSQSSSLREKLTAAGAREGKFFCADRIAVTAGEKWELWQKTGADAVEMESGTIQAVCREHGIPCATVRVISDIAGEDLPLDFNALAKADQNLDFGKLAWAIAKSPGKIGALLRLQKQTSAAAKKLAQVLEKIL